MLPEIWLVTPKAKFERVHCSLVCPYLVGLIRYKVIQSLSFYCIRLKRWRSSGNLCKSHKLSGVGVGCILGYSPMIEINALGEAFHFQIP